jgi:hypothetical protein
VVWVGWLRDYPDYRTQGATLHELEEHLNELRLAVYIPRFACGDIGEEP